MKHSWTGGQYSLWRALLSLSLAPLLATALDGWVYRVPALALCLALAIGLRDRLAALALAPVWWFAMQSWLPESSPGTWAPPILLLLHAATHGSPYGSFDARGRSDPGGNWILPRWNFALRRGLVIAAGIACFARGSFEVPWPPAVAILLAACDPGWIRPLAEPSATLVFYDGGCGLCHRFVRFLLAEDRTGRTFRFAPLQSETYRASFAPEERAAHPDSVVVRTGSGEVRIRSQGSLHCFARLGGLWRAIAALLQIVPQPVLDRIYDLIASVRLRLFARPSAACPIVPAHLARRFDR